MRRNIVNNDFNNNYRLSFLFDVHNDFKKLVETHIREALVKCIPLKTCIFILSRSSSNKIRYMCI